MKQPNLYVAIDVESRQEAESRAKSINDVNGDFGYKLNLDLITCEGVGIVTDFLDMFGRPIFADMKMWNGRRTMAQTAVNLARAGATLTNMYLHAGKDAAHTVLNAVADSGFSMQVYGVGVLTHYTDQDCRGLYGKSLRDTVWSFWQNTLQWGMPGYIMPGTLLGEIPSDPRACKLVPAIRPEWFEDKKANNQEQTVTPAYACAHGASTLVCGSPIFRSADPSEALHRILEEIGV